MCLVCLKEHLAILEREEEEEKQRKRNALSNKPPPYDAISDQEMVDKVFAFLPAVIGGQEGQAPLGFEVKSSKDMMGQIHSWCNVLDFAEVAPRINLAQPASIR